MAVAFATVAVAAPASSQQPVVAAALWSIVAAGRTSNRRPCLVVVLRTEVSPESLNSVVHGFAASAPAVRTNNLETDHSVPV